MNHLDLFSGIGGFALAASWVWPESHNIVSFCEIEKFPTQVLNKNFPGVPVHADIHNLDTRPWAGQVDLLTGGFPCQPFSEIGKRKGAKDPRHLWPEMLRVITECRPKWVVGENVGGGELFLAAEALRSKKSVLAWKTKVTPFGREVSLLRGSGPGIKDKEFGFLPTMTAKGMWPNHTGTSLKGYLYRNTGTRISLGLVDCLRILREGKDPWGSEAIDLSSLPSGQLNPSWAEIYMGYPKDWTKLPHSGTP